MGQKLLLRHNQSIHNAPAPRERIEFGLMYRRFPQLDLALQV
jgi:hypothetical protein